MSTFSWQFPWAWWLLLLLPLFFWKSPPRQPKAQLLATLHGWNLARTDPTGWRRLTWSSWFSLWPWITLLFLTIVLAAGPRWIRPEHISPPEKTGVISASAVRLPGLHGERLLWEAVVQPPPEAAGFVVLADGQGIVARQAIPPAAEPGPQVVGGMVDLAGTRSGPWTISWRNPNGETNAHFLQVELSPKAIPRRQATFVSKTEPWFFSRLWESWEEWDFAWIRPADWDPDDSADVVFFLDPPAREIPPGWMGSRAAWFWGFGPGGRGGRQELPLALEKEELHPVTKGIPFERVTVLEAFDPLPETDSPEVVDVLVQGPSGPWLLAGERSSPVGHGRWLASAFALENSDLPLQAAFPVLIAQGLEWLTGAPPLPEAIPGQTPRTWPQTLANSLREPAFWTALLFLVALWVVARGLP